MRYSRNDPAFRAGRRDAQKELLQKADAVVAAIEKDINHRSGLSPMLWSDRESREEILVGWRLLARVALEA